MKPYFKYPINVTIFVLFLVSTMGPLTAIIVDSIAYMMGAHHGFHGPWPVFREMLYWMFPVLLVALIVDIIAYNALKHSRSKLKTDAQ